MVPPTHPQNTIHASHSPDRVVVNSVVALSISKHWSFLWSNSESVASVVVEDVIFFYFGLRTYRSSYSYWWLNWVCVFGWYLAKNDAFGSSLFNILALSFVRLCSTLERLLVMGSVRLLSLFRSVKVVLFPALCVCMYLLNFSGYLFGISSYDPTGV